MPEAEDYYVCECCQCCACVEAAEQAASEAAAVSVGSAPSAPSSSRRYQASLHIEGLHWVTITTCVFVCITFLHRQIILRGVL